jgi:phosphotransferase system HPr (HPr) family protein
MTGESAKQSVVITNPQGLHFRPAAEIVKAAQRFPCDITVTRIGMDPVDGKSLLSLLTLVALPGTELTIEAKGPQALEAVEALIVIFRKDFDEEQAQ